MGDPGVNDRDWLSVQEAAKKLGMGRDAAYDAFHRGELPGAVRIGRRILVARRAIEGELSEGRVNEIAERVAERVSDEQLARMLGHLRGEGSPEHST